MPIKRVAIYDLDGTVIDSRHRYRTINENGHTRIDLDYWRENEHKAMEDTFLPLYEQYKTDLVDETCFVIVATARVINKPDAQFIRERLGCPDYVICRKHGDNQSGKTLKINGLKRFLNLKPFQGATFTFYEDNKDYLSAVVDYIYQKGFNIRGVYIPSLQGY